MRCSACGQLLADGVKECPSCGMKIEKIDELVDVGQDWPGDEQTSYEQTLYDQPYRQQPDMPMKWYKFLVYVSLVLSGISNIYSGVRSVLGMNYGSAEMAAQIYATYGGLKIIDIFYGLILIAFGIYAFIVRQKLVHYRKGAPRHVVMLYLVGMVSMIVYLAGASLAMGVNLMNIGFISNLLVSAFMVIANKIYFDKRAHLFTN